MIITYINAFVCLFIAVRLFTFNRGDSKYRLSFGLLAWAMICASSAVFIFSCFNFPQRALVAQTIMNGLVLICALKAHGNAAQICVKLKPINKLKHH